MTAALSIFSGLGLPAWAPRLLAGVLLVLSLLYIRGEIRDQAKMEVRAEINAETAETVSDIKDQTDAIYRGDTADAFNDRLSRHQGLGEFGGLGGHPSPAGVERGQASTYPGRPRPSMQSGGGRGDADPVRAERRAGDAAAGEPLRDPAGGGQAAAGGLPGELERRELAPLARRYGDPEMGKPAALSSHAERELSDYRWGAGLGITGFALLISAVGFIVYFGPRWGITDWVERLIERAFYTRGHHERGTISAPTALRRPDMEADAPAEHAADAERRHVATGEGLSGLSVVGAGAGVRGPGGDQGDAGEPDRESGDGQREGEDLREMALAGGAERAGFLRADDAHPRRNLAQALALAAFIGLGLAVAIVATGAAIASVSLVVDTLSRGEDPADYFQVKRIDIPDAKPDEAVVLDVDRKILKPFKASWVVEVGKLDEKIGGYSLHCSGSGQNIYRPDNSLPAVVTLSWWLGHDRCKLPPGRYRVETAWSLGLERSSPVVEATSNVFRVGW